MTEKNGKILKAAAKRATKAKGKERSLAEPLHATPETHLLCRYLRHKWDFVGLYHGKAKGIIVALVHCAQCGCVREQPIDRKGEIDGNHYRYPAGYLMTGTGHRIYPIDVRREMLRRFRAAESREALLDESWAVRDNERP